MNKLQQNTIARAAAVEATLREGPKTMAEHAAAVGISVQAFRPHIARLMYGEHRHAYLCEWKREPYPTAYYQWGNLPDAEQPPVGRAGGRRKLATPRKVVEAVTLPAAFFGKR